VTTSRTAVAASAAIAVLEIVAVGVIYFAWKQGWDWLWHCNRGPARGDESGCVYDNVLVLLIPPGRPLLVAALRWNRAWRRGTRD